MGIDFNALRDRYNHYQENGVDDGEGFDKPRKQILDLSNYETATFWKPEAGPHAVDIIPYKVTSKNHPSFKAGDVDYVLSVHVHRGVGPNKDNFICMKETFGKSCPICEEMESLHESIKAAEMDKGKSQREAWVNAKNHPDVKALKPKHRVLYNIIDVDDREKGIQLYEAPYYWFEKPLAEKFTVKQARKPNTPFFFDPENGLTVVVHSTDEEYNGNKFVKSEPTEFDRRDVTYEESIVEDTYPLDSLLVIPTYEEVKNAFLGIEMDDEEEEEDEVGEKPKATVTVPKTVEKFSNTEDPVETREERMARIKAKKEAKKAVTGPKCPVERGIFGDDYCAYDECEECPLVAECGEASESGV